jgi:hypothetical protein
MSMWRTPRWLTASMTAFWVAGAAPMVPASPMPLAPSGLMSVGVSLGSSSKLGSSRRHPLGLLLHVERGHMHGDPAQLQRP